ncbi:hypothetical protein RI578_06530 [Streptomyces sp. BB1-1-1]|uniref:hypothetical protein n=1 Tax=Streptomyces sp. BB1-1-1 TaxID=3074430 RepID=UPI002877E43B|nr:hypothetical protein [Streptomyces sp. BB1-1-1]WND33969.1 hypothetical protein RI578_06530 [Streptomyces sp. BB1-1-1]
MSDLAARSWRPSRTQKIIAALVLLLIWTAIADTWTDKGCTLPQGYRFVITHGGSPDRDQGCEDEPGGPEYTDTYYG